jgi:integrase
VSPFKRGRIYYIDVRWRGCPRLKLSTDTTNKSRAIAMEGTVHALRSAGRRDLLGLLAEGKLSLPELHDAWVRDREELEQLKAKAESPHLTELLDEWFDWLASPAGVSPRTKRRYATHTIAQYRRSWNGVLATLSRGQDATLADITTGFLLDYRRARKRATGGKERKTTNAPLTGATLNRDFAAVGSFLTWLRDVKGIHVQRPKLPREREGRGRERWLSADELRTIERHCPAEWWPFFATLFYTGARLGEVQALRGADALLHAKRLTIHEGDRRLKSREAVRDLPIPVPLERALGAHLTRVAPGPVDLVFPGDFQNRKKLRGVWKRTCKAAGIVGATPHDARHTFAVHAAQAGVPIVRLQKLLGHATAAMTMRYMKHAPEAYLDADGQAIAAHMAGVGDRETTARAEAARAEIKRA